MADTLPNSYVLKLKILLKRYGTGRGKLKSNCYFDNRNNNARNSNKVENDDSQDREQKMQWYECCKSYSCVKDAEIHYSKTFNKNSLNNYKHPDELKKLKLNISNQAVIKVSNESEKKRSSVVVCPSTLKEKTSSLPVNNIAGTNICRMETTDIDWNEHMIASSMSYMEFLSSSSKECTEGVVTVPDQSETLTTFTEQEKPSVEVKTATESAMEFCAEKPYAEPNTHDLLLEEKSEEDTVQLVDSAVSPVETETEKPFMQPEIAKLSIDGHSIAAACKEEDRVAGCESVDRVSSKVLEMEQVKLENWVGEDEGTSDVVSFNKEQLSLGKPLVLPSTHALSQALTLPLPQGSSFFMPFSVLFEPLFVEVFEQLLQVTDSSQQQTISWYMHLNEKSLISTFTSSTSTVAQLCQLQQVMEPVREKIDMPQINPLFLCSANISSLPTQSVSHHSGRNEDISGDVFAEPPMTIGTVLVARLCQKTEVGKSIKCDVSLHMVWNNVGHVSIPRSFKSNSQVCALGRVQLYRIRKTLRASLFIEDVNVSVLSHMNQHEESIVTSQRHSLTTAGGSPHALLQSTASKYSDPVEPEISEPSMELIGAQQGNMSWFPCVKVQQIRVLTIPASLSVPLPCQLPYIKEPTTAIKDDVQVSPMNTVFPCPIKGVRIPVKLLECDVKSVSLPTQLMSHKPTISGMNGNEGSIAGSPMMKSEVLAELDQESEAGRSHGCDVLFQLNGSCFMQFGMFCTTNRGVKVGGLYGIKIDLRRKTLQASVFIQHMTKSSHIPVTQLDENIFVSYSCSLASSGSTPHALPLCGKASQQLEFLPKFYALLDCTYSRLQNRVIPHMGQALQVSSVPHQAPLLEVQDGVRVPEEPSTTRPHRVKSNFSKSAKPAGKPTSFPNTNTSLSLESSVQASHFPTVEPDRLQFSMLSQESAVVAIIKEQSLAVPLSPCQQKSFVGVDGAINKDCTILPGSKQEYIIYQFFSQLILELASVCATKSIDAIRTKQVHASFRDSDAIRLEGVCTSFKHIGATGMKEMYESFKHSHSAEREIVCASVRDIHTTRREELLRSFKHIHTTKSKEVCTSFKHSRTTETEGFYASFSDNDAIRIAGVCSSFKHIGATTTERVCASYKVCAEVSISYIAFTIEMAEFDSTHVLSNISVNILWRISCSSEQTLCGIIEAVVIVISCNLQIWGSYFPGVLTGGCTNKAVLVDLPLCHQTWFMCALPAAQLEPKHLKCSTNGATQLSIIQLSSMKLKFELGDDRMVSIHHYKVDAIQTDTNMRMTQFMTFLNCVPQLESSLHNWLPRQQHCIQPSNCGPDITAVVKHSLSSSVLPMKSLTDFKSSLHLSPTRQPLLVQTAHCTPGAIFTVHLPSREPNLIGTVNVVSELTTMNHSPLMQKSIIHSIHQLKSIKESSYLNAVQPRIRSTVWLIKQEQHSSVQLNARSKQVLNLPPSMPISASASALSLNLQIFKETNSIYDVKGTGGYISRPTNYFRSGKNTISVVPTDKEHHRRTAVFHVHELSPGSTSHASFLCCSSAKPCNQLVDQSVVDQQQIYGFVKLPAESCRKAAVEDKKGNSVKCNRNYMESCHPVVQDNPVAHHELSNNCDTSHLDMKKQLAQPHHPMNVKKKQVLMETIDGLKGIRRKQSLSRSSEGCSNHQNVEDESRPYISDSTKKKGGGNYADDADRVRKKCVSKNDASDEVSRDHLKKPFLQPAFLKMRRQTISDRWAMFVLFFSFISGVCCGHESGSYHNTTLWNSLLSFFVNIMELLAHPACLASLFALVVILLVVLTFVKIRSDHCSTRQDSYPPPHHQIQPRVVTQPQAETEPFAQASMLSFTSLNGTLVHALPCTGDSTYPAIQEMSDPVPLSSLALSPLGFFYDNTTASNVGEENVTEDDEERELLLNDGEDSEKKEQKHQPHKFVAGFSHQVSFDAGLVQCCNSVLVYEKEESSSGCVPITSSTGVDVCQIDTCDEDSGPPCSLGSSTTVDCLKCRRRRRYELVQQTVESSESGGGGIGQSTCKLDEEGRRDEEDDRMHPLQDAVTSNLEGGALAACVNGSIVGDIFEDVPSEAEHNSNSVAFFSESNGYKPSHSTLAGLPTLTPSMYTSSNTNKNADNAHDDAVVVTNVNIAVSTNDVQIVCDKDLKAYVVTVEPEHASLVFANPIGFETVLPIPDDQAKDHSEPRTISVTDKCLKCFVNQWEHGDLDHIQESSFYPP